MPDVKVPGRWPTGCTVDLVNRSHHQEQKEEWGHDAALFDTHCEVKGTLNLANDETDYIFWIAAHVDAE